VPWIVDDEACDVLRKFTHLKNRFEPYLTSHSITGVVEQGLPLMRPMLLEFPEDKTTWFLDQQYMFGPDLLVAPVFGESQVDYYVPKGVWTNILTGDEVAGPAWVTEQHSMMTLPLLLRPDTAIVIGKVGHSVIDAVSSRGFTVVVSRQCTKKIDVTIRTRSGELQVTIEPVKDGVKVSSAGKDFDVVMVGGGRGLETAKTDAQNGIATVTW
jgi:alpha-D-xyloside xylohydrolase